MPGTVLGASQHWLRQIRPWSWEAYILMGEIDDEQVSNIFIRIIKKEIRACY